MPNQLFLDIQRIWNLLFLQSSLLWDVVRGLVGAVDNVQIASGGVNIGILALILQILITFTNLITRTICIEILGPKLIILCIFLMIVLGVVREIAACYHPILKETQSK